MVNWADPLVIAPVGLLGVLVLARLARLRPAMRPLVGPFALFVAVVIGLAVFGGGPLPASPWKALLFLLPLLTLVVRANIIAFQWLFHRRRGEEPPSLLDSVISVGFYGVGLAAIAHYWFNVELTPFLATSAVVGAVVGLALQDTLGNLFAGIALHTEAPFGVGDWVRVGDRDGRIEQVSWRAMRLRTWDGDTLTIPNGEVSRHALLNYSVPATAHSRLILLNIGYTTPPARAIAALRGALAQVEGMAAGSTPNVRIVGYQDWAIRYEVRYFFASYEDYRLLEGEIYRLVWYHLRRAGIEVATPISNVSITQPAPRVEETADRLLGALRGIDLFRTLSESELRTVAGRLRPLHYTAGERIIEEGAQGDSFFLIDRGNVRVLRRLGGTPREVARLHEGECFGEGAMLTGQERTATVVAATDVDLLMIDKAGFQDIVANNPDVAVDISTLLARRRAALSDAEADVTTRLRGGPQAEDEDLHQKILHKIRSYFGL